MMTPLLCERVERRHPQEKCASKCIRGTALLPSSVFLTQSDLKSEISDLKLILHVWLSSKST